LRLAPSAELETTTVHCFTLPSSTIRDRGRNHDFIQAVADRIDRRPLFAGRWETRVQLAACYRLVARYRMTDLIYTHISARVPASRPIPLNPYGLMFEEVTASNL